MKTLVACLLSVVTVLGWSTAQQIDVPLKLLRDNQAYDDQPMAISSLKIAPFDMLAPGAPEAPLWIDYGKSTPEHGIKDTRGTRSPATVAGRNCSRGDPSLCLDDPTSRSSQGDLYLLLDYFDEGKPGYKLQVQYPVNIMGQCVPQLHTGDVTLENTRTWKQHQFRLKNAWFGGKAGDLWTKGPSVRIQKDGSQFCPTGNATLTTITTPPAGLKVPSATTPQPLYAQFPLGDTTCSIMLDKTSTSLTTYDRVYLDTNFNADLTDEKPLTSPDSRHASSKYTRLPFEIRVPINGKQVPCPLGILVSTYEGPDHETKTQVLLQTRACYVGKLSMGGKRYNVAVSDSNANGRFDDVVSSRSEANWTASRKSAYYPSDHLYILSPESEMWYDDAGALGLLFINGTLYDTKVDIPAGVLHLIPFAGKTAHLKLPMDIEKMTVFSPDAKRSVFAVAPGREMIVPEGEWLAGDYAVRRVDSDGAEWRLIAMSSDKAKLVMATADSPATLVFGEPYRLFLSVPEKSVKNVRGGKDTAELEYVAIGQGDEMVLRMQLQSGLPMSTAMTSGTRANQPREPAYLITKPDGELVAKGAFEYG